MKVDCQKIVAKPEQNRRRALKFEKRQNKGMQKRKTAASYQKLFFGLKNIVLSQSYHILKSQNTYNYIARANFNRTSPKINFKIHLFLQFLRYTFEKVLGGQNFDLGLSSKNIEF